jgi:hypothetical protein
VTERVKARISSIACNVNVRSDPDSLWDEAGGALAIAAAMTASISAEVGGLDGE